MDGSRSHVNHGKSRTLQWRITSNCLKQNIASPETEEFAKLRHTLYVDLNRVQGSQEIERNIDGFKSINSFDISPVKSDQSCRSN